MLSSQKLSKKGEATLFGKLESMRHLKNDIAI